LEVVVEQVFQIQCIKTAMSAAGNVLKDKDGKPEVADKEWKAPSGQVYNFCKRGKGTLKTALLPFEDAAKALTFPSVFAPGPDCKNEDLQAIYDQAAEAAERRQRSLDSLKQAEKDKARDMSSAEMNRTFVTRGEFVLLSERIDAMEGELEALGKVIEELRDLRKPVK
jgi:hypothetical protein